MPERKRIKKVYLRKQCVHHVCVINHFADSSNYKYDYRRYRIVAHLMPEGRVTVSFLVITLPFSSRAEQKSAQKGPTEGFYMSKRLARENNWFTENVKTLSHNCFFFLRVVILARNNILVYMSSFRSCGLRYGLDKYLLPSFRHFLKVS